MFTSYYTGNCKLLRWFPKLEIARIVNSQINCSPLNSLVGIHDTPYFTTAYSNTENHALQKRCPRWIHLKTGVVAWTGETEVFRRLVAMALGGACAREAITSKKTAKEK